MKNLIIISARGFGREIYNLALQCKENGKEWTVKGFLDDNPKALEKYNYKVPILSSVEDYTIKPDDVFACALGDVKQRKKYASIILAKGGVFTNIIHPTVNINGSNVAFGKGIIVHPLTVISNDVTIGDFVIINSFAAIGHDTKIGKWSQVSAFAHIGGGSTIGENVTIHPSAVIVPKTDIANDVTIGAGSIVLKNVKPGITVFGNPAKELKF